jgi:hypothetical protein
VALIFSLPLFYPSFIFIFHFSVVHHHMETAASLKLLSSLQSQGQPTKGLRLFWVQALQPLHKVLGLDQGRQFLPIQVSIFKHYVMLIAARRCRTTR